MSDPNVVMILEKKTNIAMFILGVVRRNSFPYPRRQINVAYSKNVEMPYFIHNKIGIFSWSNYVFCPKQYKAITKIALSPYHICIHIFLYCRYKMSLNRWIQFLNRNIYIEIDMICDKIYHIIFGQLVYPWSVHTSISWEKKHALQGMNRNDKWEICVCYRFKISAANIAMEMKIIGICKLGKAYW